MAHLSSRIFDLIGEMSKIDVTQDIDERAPSHWFLSSASNPFLHDLNIDLFCVPSVFPYEVPDSCPVAVVQEKDAERGVLCTNFLRDVDPPLPPTEPDQLKYCQFSTCKKVFELCYNSQGLLKKFL